MIKFSIGICTYNRSEMLQSCLKALNKHLSHRDDFEIIVVDNNSTDNTAELLDEFNCIKRFVEYNQGLSFARNRLIKESVGDYILFLDDDSIISNDILREYELAVLTFPDNYIYGGKVIPEDEVSPPKWFDSKFHMAFSILDLGTKTFKFKKPYGPIGANFMVKKSFIGDVSFRTDLGRVGNILLSGEETDFIVKLGGAETCIYVGTAMVNHHFEHKRYSSLWAIERFKQNGISDYIMRKQNHKLLTGLLSQLYHLMLSLKGNNLIYTKCRFYSLTSYIYCFFK
ncbi:glycosyltransferase [Photobacterium sanguinicancri]|uniref:Glycosyltransferase n=1 Tax=Photobacterium sanguinicancri TaxID=875932 RepID=A0AAW7Y566_9GAMM|nr:glycosyltransferase [Photobacterium sanguinicancri]MDO6542473.1 glycosyltransferase [Photobacterium sanguinicancri]